MTIKEISPKLHQFVNEVSLGYKGTIDLNLIREAADRLEELESKQENLIDYSADLNNRLDKAESYIEKLEKQLAENQPEWISVEDRLPFAEYGESDNVLAVCAAGVIYMLYFDGSNWCYPAGEPYCCKNSESKITHWMPLPEPPKQKEPTFKDVFLKAFPKAVYPDVDCCTIFPKQFNPNACNFVCEECWNQPYFEEEEGEADA